MNETETVISQEKIDSQPELLTTPLEQNRELESLLEKYKTEKIHTIENETKAILQSGAKLLELTSSIGYTSEQIQQFSQEQGVTVKLAEIQSRIAELGMSVKNQIENPTNN